MDERIKDLTKTATTLDGFGSQDSTLKGTEKVPPELYGAETDTNNVSNPSTQSMSGAATKTGPALAEIVTSTKNNTTAIDDNTNNISNNATAIGNNTTAIGTNTTNIGTNTTKITDLEASAEANEKLNGLTNGTVLDLVTITIILDGGNYYAEIEKEGGGDVRFELDNTTYTLDCTTNTGTVGKARSNMLGFGAADSQLEANVMFCRLDGSQAPEFIAVTGESAYQTVGCNAGIITFPTQAIYESNGFFTYQRYNNVVDNGVDDGLISYQNAKARQQGVTYGFGVQSALNIDTGASPDSMQLSTGIGVLTQMHGHLFDPTDGTQGYYVINHPTEPYKYITNLNQLDVYSDGSSIDDKDRFKFQVFGQLQSEDSTDKIYISLPSGGYTSDSSAINDEANQNTNIDRLLFATAFRICECVVKYESKGGGKWTNLLGGTVTVSTLGLSFGATGGGASSSEPIIDIEQVKTVGKGGIVQYLDHQSAVESITDASHTKPYNVYSYAGIYALTETLQTSEHISFKGANAFGDASIEYTDNVLSINNNEGNGNIDNMKFVMTPVIDNKINTRSVSTAEEDFVIKDTLFQNNVAGDIGSTIFSAEGNSRLKIANCVFNYLQTGTSASVREHKILDVNISNTGSVLVNSCEFNMLISDASDTFTFIKNTNTGNIGISNCLFNIIIPSGVSRDATAIIKVVEFLQNTGIKVFGDCTVNIIDANANNHIVDVVSIPAGSGNFVLDNIVVNNQGTNNNVAFLDVQAGGVARLTNIATYDLPVFARGTNFTGDYLFGNEKFNKNDLNMVGKNIKNVGTINPDGETTSFGGDVFIKTKADGDIALNIQKYSATGRAQMRLSDSDGAELWRFGDTGGTTDNFSFWNGSATVLELNRITGLVSCSNDLVAGGTISASPAILATEMPQLQQVEGLLVNFLKAVDETRDISTTGGGYFGEDGLIVSRFSGAENEQISIKAYLRDFPDNDRPTIFSRYDGSTLYGKMCLKGRKNNVEHGSISFYTYDGADWQECYFRGGNLTVADAIIAAGNITQKGVALDNTYAPISKTIPKGSAVTNDYIKFVSIKMTADEITQFIPNVGDENGRTSIDFQFGDRQGAYAGIASVGYTFGAKRLTSTAFSTWGTFANYDAIDSLYYRVKITNAQTTSGGAKSTYYTNTLSTASMYNFGSDSVVELQFAVKALSTTWDANSVNPYFKILNYQVGELDVTQSIETSTGNWGQLV